MVPPTGAAPEADIVLTEAKGAALVITINRPGARNALTRAVCDAIMDGYRQLDASDELRVGVVAGAGGTFCAGMDLKAFAAGELAGDQIVRELPRKPLIAAIEGYALAGGLELALACDLIVAAADATLGLPEPRYGLVALGGGAIRLPKRMPYHAAMELLLTGATISAERAAGMGLVNRLAGPGQALDTALELAEAIAANAPISIDVSKALASTTGDVPEAEMWARQDALADSVFASEDAHEGAVAFSEKRSPRWTGR
jgi:enoyl-CoA hydratase